MINVAAYRARIPLMSLPGASLPGVSTTALLAGALLGVPSTLGVVITNQITRARRQGFMPRPEYVIDLTVDPPWVSGSPLDVAFLGDSLVHGVGAPLPGQSLPAQTAYRLAAHLGRPVHMRGFGIASSRVEDVIAEQVPQLDERVDVVLVSVGANDATRAAAPWDFARHIEELAVTANRQTGGAPVVFTGLPYLQLAPLLGRPLRDLAGLLGDTLHTVQRRVATQTPEARYIDVRREVVDAIRQRGRELFAEDWYHPNPAGYALLAEGIARSLAELLTAEGFHQTERSDKQARNPTAA